VINIPNIWHTGRGVTRRKNHLVGVLTDKQMKLVVSKFWSRQHKCWKYEVTEEWLLKHKLVLYN